MVKVIQRMSDTWKRLACIQLMFRTHKPNIQSKKYLTYAAIAKALKMNYGKVYHICTTAHLS